MIGGSEHTDLETYTIKIDDVDITPFCLSVLIFQDIFSPCWVCELYMMDSNNLIMNVPIKQKSKIEITLETKHNSITDDSKVFNLMVYGIQDKQFFNVGDQRYTIIGTSKYFFKNQGLRVQHTYKNETPTEIAKKILTSKLGAELEIDTCDNTITTTLSNITPFHAVFKMCKFSIVEKASDVMFWQKDENKFLMKSVEQLYTHESSGWILKFRPNFIETNNSFIKEDRNLCIHDYQFFHYDTGSASTGGMYASKTISFDFRTKKFTTDTFKFGDDIPEDKKDVNFDDDMIQENSRIKFIPKHSNMLGSSDKSVFDMAEKWNPSRQSSLLKLEKDKIVVQCPGGVGAWKLPGKTLEVEMPSNQNMVKEEDDKDFAGTYLVTSVAHYCSATAYYCNYELVKKRKNSENNF